MQIKIHHAERFDIAEVISDDVLMQHPQDALDLMMNCFYSGQSAIIIHSHNLPAAFFDLASGLAGEILQKFSNYNMYLAIVGDVSQYPGSSIQAFIRESNKAGRINFVKSKDEAIHRLTN